MSFPLHSVPLHSVASSVRLTPFGPQVKPSDAEHLSSAATDR
jgi:hypothetical protein